VEIGIKGRRMHDIKYIKLNITIKLNAVPLDTIIDCCVWLLEGHKKCVASKGSCFAG
jgi:hypothetical protein